jgi:ribosome-associated translation inhibitor RaiA
LIKAADEAIDKISRQVSKAQQRPGSLKKGGNSIRQATV